MCPLSTNMFKIVKIVMSPCMENSNLTKAWRTLDAKRTNNILPKRYQIGTKVGTFFFFEGGSMENV